MRRAASEELCLLVQVETRAALDSLEAITQVDGVDGVFIGPATLPPASAISARPPIRKSWTWCAKPIRRIRAQGKAAGVLATDAATSRRYLEAGAVFAAVGVDLGILTRETTDWRQTIAEAGSR